jgi:hypothetical protein
VDSVGVPVYSGRSSRADDCLGTWPVVPATALPPHGAPGEELARDARKWWTPEGGVARKAKVAEQNLSAAEKAVRERITELYVHIACGGVRGPILGGWQSCKCEDSPEEWKDYDVSRERDLCLICVRGTAGGTSRWSWLGCEACRAVNQAIFSRYGKQIPLGRHSIMNGYSVRGGPPSDVQREQAERLTQFAHDQRALYRWQSDEFSRLARRFPADADIPLRIWKLELPASREASIDAMIRLTGDESLFRGLDP